MSEIEKRTENDIVPDGLYGQIREILETARKRAHAAVNFSMVLAYWEIGRLIVEQQGGAERAEYGKGLIAEPSARLTADFGKGFDESNLTYMRRFYLSFPNLDALRPELSWTHYRKLTAVKNEAARAWYMTDAADAVRDVFEGQPNQGAVTYLRDAGRTATFKGMEALFGGYGAVGAGVQGEFDEGYANARIALPTDVLLRNVQAIQRRNRGIRQDFRGEIRGAGGRARG